MSESKHCIECQATESTKFRSLKGEKWREAIRNDLIKVSWVKGSIFCNICYMQLVENSLKRGTKRAKVADEKAMNKNVLNVVEEEASMNVDLTRAIKVMAKILYEREHIKKEVPIYAFDEMRRILQEIEPNLTNFFD